MILTAVPRLRAFARMFSYVVACTTTMPSIAQSTDRPPAASRSPELPMVIVVPFAQGGSAERVARIVAESLGQALNRRIATRTVRAGIGVAALNEVAALAPDEIRIGYVTSTQLIEATIRNPPPGYNAMSEFEWIGIVGSFGNAVVVGAKERAATFDEWLHDLPTRGRRQRWGVGAASATSTLAARFLASNLGIDVEFVEFLAADSSYEALRNEQIDAAFDGVPNAIDESRRVDGRILAVTSRARSPALSAVPAFGERWKGEDFSVFGALVVSQKDSEAVRARLKSGWYGLNRLTQMRARLEQTGVTYVGLDGAEAVTYMEEAYLRHARLLAKFGK